MRATAPAGAAGPAAKARTRAGGLPAVRVAGRPDPLRPPARRQGDRRVGVARGGMARAPGGSLPGLWEFGDRTGGVGGLNAGKTHTDGSNPIEERKTDHDKSQVQALRRRHERGDLHGARGARRGARAAVAPGGGGVHGLLKLPLPQPLHVQPKVVSLMPSPPVAMLSLDVEETRFSPNPCEVAVPCRPAPSLQTRAEI